MNELTIRSFFNMKDNLVDTRKNFSELVGVPEKNPLLGVEYEFELKPGAIRESVLALLQVSLNPSTTANESATARLVVQHTDASLIDGMEIVVGPLCREHQEVVLNHFLPILREVQTTSGRESTHVHLDVRDFTIERLENLCALYRVVEPVYFAWIASSRLDNPFCRPWFVDAFDVFTPRKYQALNLLPSGFTLVSPDVTLRPHTVRVAPRGSVEFRHFPAVTGENHNLFREWLLVIEELYHQSLLVNRNELLRESFFLNNNSANTAFLEKHLPVTANKVMQVLRPARITQIMSPVITQLKSVIVGSIESPFLVTSPEAVKTFLGRQVQ